MAFDTFLKIDGILGESSDEKYKDWIEVLSLYWRMRQPTSATASSAGGATAERANFSDFKVVKRIDKATPKLALACADGTHIKEINIELCRAGGDRVKYMEYKLSNCIVSSISTGGSSGGEPSETLTFNYGKIEWTYTRQRRSDGSGAGNVAAGWDLQTNKKA
jgi:type VI secretion system secreted protein Hcp